jgi:hypothetical protein
LIAAIVFLVSILFHSHRSRTIFSSSVVTMQVLGVLLSLIAFTLHINALPIFDSLFYSLTTRANPLCNGFAQLCSRKYSDITFIGAHDSAFVGDLPTQNQEKSLKDQLGGGIRFLQSQTHKTLDTLSMCHTSCALEFGGLVQDYLKTVKTFLDANPSEVVTILLTNPDNAPMNTFDGIYKNVGLDKMSFRPSTSPNPLPIDQWPTLGDMIKNNQRLVTFIGTFLRSWRDDARANPNQDYGADETKVPYLLNEFKYFWETPFDTTDSKFAQCTMDRKNELDGSGKSSMSLMNHFLDTKFLFTEVLVPDRGAAGKTNAKTGDGSIGAQADLCKSQHGKYPNVVLIDFFGEGDAIGAQKMLNGL